MAIVRKIRRSVKRRLLFLGIWAACGAAAAGGLYFAAEYTACRRYESRISEMEETLIKTERLAYVALRDIAAGELFSEENTALRRVRSDEAQERFAGEGIMQKRALFDVAEGTRLREEMGTEAVFEEGTRECVFSDIALAETLQSKDVVDIRIQYPNGENYCVAAKKELQRNEADRYESRFLLSKEEQLFLSSALYDERAYGGTRLYAVRYVAVPLQPATEADYIPAAAVIKQLGFGVTDEERLCRLRWELEGRLDDRRED